jgi:selenocysteine lyase/cysteine desulfurase
MQRRKFFIASAGAIGAVHMLSPLAMLASPSLPPARTPIQPPEAPIAPEDTTFWNVVRSQFPLQTERVYLNTGGLGASPYAVIDAVKAKMDELEKVCETGHSETLLNEIKADMSSLLGCDADELAFTRNTTEGINIIANGLPLAKGDEVILTTHEHVGNAMTWVGLQQHEGVVIRLFEPSTESAQTNIDRILKLITPRTRVISIPHIVTTTGLIMPVKEIAAIARAKNIFFLIDGAQSAGQLKFSLHDIGCDAYATSGHKWLMGPKETGLLYVRKSKQDAVRARHIGAYSGGEFDLAKGILTPFPSAQRYEYGTVSIPLRVGLGAAFKFIRTIGMDNIMNHDLALGTALHDGLRAIKGVTMLSPFDPSMRSAMITISHAACTNNELQQHLDKFDLRTRIVTEGGLSALRLSLHCYNSFDDVHRIIEGVRSVK